MPTLRPGLDYLSRHLERGVPAVEELERLIASLGIDFWTTLYDSRDSVMLSMLDSLREEGRLTERVREKLGALLVETDGELRNRCSVEVGRDVTELTVLRTLNALGMLTLTEDETQIYPFVTPDLFTRFLSYALRWDAKSRRAHLLAVSLIRHWPLPSDDGAAQLLEKRLRDESRRADELYVESVLTKWVDELRSQALKMTGVEAPEPLQRHLDVVLLPTSTDFYDYGAKYYRDRHGKGQEHLIFATTTGLVLPEEHHGDAYFEKVPCRSMIERLSKNPLRKDYFDVLIDAPRDKPRVYFFEFKGASSQLRRNCDDIDSDPQTSHLVSAYIEDATSILESFLQRDSFSLFAINDFSQTFRNLTLGNGWQVLISGRESTKYISHGFSIKPRISIRTAKEYVKLRELIEGVVSGSAAAAAVAKGLGQADAVEMGAAFAGGFMLPLAYAALKCTRDQRRARQLVEGIFETVQSKAYNRTAHRIKGPDALPASEARHLAGLVVRALQRGDPKWIPV